MLRNKCKVSKLMLGCKVICVTFLPLNFPFINTISSNFSLPFKLHLNARMKLWECALHYVNYDFSSVSSALQVLKTSRNHGHITFHTSKIQNFALPRNTALNLSVQCNYVKHTFPNVLCSVLWESKLSYVMLVQQWCPTWSSCPKKKGCVFYVLHTIASFTY